MNEQCTLPIRPKELLAFIPAHKIEPGWLSHNAFNCSQAEKYAQHNNKVITEELSLNFSNLLFIKHI